MFSHAQGGDRSPSFVLVSVLGQTNEVQAKTRFPKPWAGWQKSMDWSDQRGPFGRVVPPGARVLVKPNLVLHQNEGSGGLDCLVTHLP